MDEFFEKLNSNSTLETYNTVKRNYNFEVYLTEIKNPNYRIAVCKLRTSTQNFPVEIKKKIQKHSKIRENVEFVMRMKLKMNFTTL